MNGINVPDNYKHMMRRERNTPEYNEAIIRDYVNAHPDMVLTSQHFVDAMDGLTTAPMHVRKLVKRGKLVRTSVKNGQRGHAYKYRWVNGGSVEPVKRGEPVVTKPRTAFATDYELKRLDAWFLEYTKHHVDSNVMGASHFRQWVYGEQTKVEESTNEQSNESDNQ